MSHWSFVMHCTQSVSPMCPMPACNWKVKNARSSKVDYESFRIIRSSPKSRPNNMGQMSVRPYVRPSTISFSNADEIWYVGRGRWVMHDSMPYDPIQDQGHETFKVKNSSIFKIYLLRHFQCELANDQWFWNYGTISNFCMDQIFDICLSFCVTWLRTWKGLRFRRSWTQSRMGLILF